VPAVLGLTLAAILAVAACFCARRIKKNQNKKHFAEATLPFQPPKCSTRTKALRSPNGQTHYLKKSPSPTTASKPLPGPGSPETLTALAPQTLVTKYSEENEVSKAIANCDTRSENQDEVDDFGKLGTLVFKLRYLVDRNALVVSVVRCRSLPFTRGGTSNGSAVNHDSNAVNQLQTNGKIQSATTIDPYVKLQLLPDKKQKVKTR
jgi:hypothetical protein